MKTVASLLLLIFTSYAHAQVNAYATVTSISSTTLNVSSANETYASFTSGLQVIVIQMQDNVIGSNTSNNSSFGNLSTIASAGDYEVATIASVVRSAGSLTQLVINSPLAKTFNISSNSNVQVVSFPLLGSNGYTTTSNISAVAWNGTVGGVVAFRVNGTLTLNHHITADYAGFRGGTSNTGTAGSCDAGMYRASANDLYGNKGEGIFRVTAGNQAAGRAKIINGGGGGSSHNGGGGGGANYTTGGEGGGGYGCSTGAGGLGGADLSLFISGLKVFMGGGGGAGEANNSYNTAGGAGGGIIIIQANEVATTGSGSALRISANGASPANVGNDGAGGGGAGGSILLKVATWNVSATKPLQISANGGTGGSVTDAAAHGGGGGGGQGAVVFSSSIPSTNITTTTSNGAGGRNYAGGTFAGSGGGSSNQGIFNGSFALLAAHILDFSAEEKNETMTFKWKVDQPQRVRTYEVQCSADNRVFRKVQLLANNSREGEIRNLRVPKSALLNAMYFRLVVTDDHGTGTTSRVVKIQTEANRELSLVIFPNPVQHQSRINVHSPHGSIAQLQLINSFGKTIMRRSVHLLPGKNSITIHELTQLSSGQYHLLLNSGGSAVAGKLLVAH